jgi:hypothetical protein
LFMNCEIGPSWESSCGPLFTRFRLLAFVFISISVACAVLRLLPPRWNLRRSPLCQRLWPAFAASGVGLAVWFVYSASPYQIPMFDAGGMGSATLKILHVEKRGFRFYETCVSEFRDRRVWVARADRRWIQYRFDEQNGSGVASQILSERTRAFVQEAKGWNLHTPPPKALWTWNAEGWYLVTPERRFSFTGDGVQPPQEVKALFSELESSAPEQDVSSVRDICLGFCYDPAAALGLSSLEARSWLLRAE